MGEEDLRRPRVEVEAEAAFREPAAAAAEEEVVVVVVAAAMQRTLVT